MADGKTVGRYTTIKLRLHPTEAQVALIEKTFGCCRYLWNKMLEDVQEFYAATDIHFIPTPAHYKKEAPFLKEVDSQALCTVHQNLRRAFLDFFRAPGSFGYPQFKCKKRKQDSFSVYCRAYRTGPSILLSEKGLQMPKLGLIPVTLHRTPGIDWALKLVTITKSTTGNYFAALSFSYEVPEPERVIPTPETTLGLNYSLTRFYVDSQGQSPTLPPIQAEKEKLAQLQRKLARMQPNSKRRAKQLQKLQRLCEHMTNQRKDFIHKESRRIANAWDAVCVRETNLVDLSQKFAQGSVLDFSFGAFRSCLKYKLEEQGKAFLVVEATAPTAKTCHTCGCINDNLTLREKTWRCPSCGTAIDRSRNAAQNLRDFGLNMLAGA